MPPRLAGTFKKTGDSVASPDFRLTGRNLPGDPASVDLETAPVRTLLIQPANFSMNFESVRDECLVENAESDTYTANRSKAVALFQDVMAIRRQQGGWKLAPTKSEVERLDMSPPINFSRRNSDEEYRFQWPDGHARLTSTPSPSSAQMQTQTPQQQTPQTGSTSQTRHNAMPTSDDANRNDTVPDADRRYADLLDKFQQLEERVRRTESTTDQLEREGAGTSATAVSLAIGEFSEWLMPQLRQTVNRPLGVVLPDTTAWDHLRIEQEFFASGLSEADRKQLLRGYKMDPRMTFAPGKLEEQDKKKFSATAKEKENTLYKQGILLRDFTRPLIHSIDRSAHALAKLCELDKTSGLTWTTEQLQAQYTAAVNLLFSSLGAQRDQHRLLSSAASSVERDRKEMVVQAVHPRYTLPEQPNKLQTRKLWSDEERADARQFDQSMFFSDKRNAARSSQSRTSTRRLSKAQARAKKRARSLSHQVDPADPAVTDATKKGPPTPGTKNKNQREAK